MSLPHLYCDGKAFVEDGGERRWVYAGSSDFPLWQKFMAGEDISGILNQRRAVGANVLRVFCMFDGSLGTFHPWEGQWADSIRALIPLAELFGLRIKFDVLADAQVAMPDPHLQQRWWHDIVITCADYSNTLVSLGNEFEQNGFNPANFERPIGAGRLLLSRGSATSDLPPWGDYSGPYIEPFDFIEWHGRRDYPKYLFGFEDAWYIADGQVHPVENPHHPMRPVIHDEPIGFAEDAVSGRRANDTYSAQVMALTARAYGCGGTFHSDAGLKSQLWTGNTMKCAEAFFRAMNALIGEDY